MSKTAPAEVQDNPEFETQLGLTIAGTFCILILGWASFAQMDVGAYAHGEVSVSGNSPSVQHRDGGIITGLKVAEGDHVQAGQVLIELSPEQTRASERSVSAQVYALLAQRARMLAERDRLASFSLPPELQNLPAEDQALADAAIQLQRQHFNARRTVRATESGVLIQQTQQLIEEAKGLERQALSVREQARLINEELLAMRSLMEKGYAPLTRVRAIERSAAALSGEEASLNAQLARTRAAISESQLTATGVDVRLNEQVTDELKQLDVQLNDLQPRLKELRDRIERHVIRAPATGSVVDLKVFTLGGVIQPGQTLMKVVPDDASQVIVASVNPMDIDNLRLGMDTKIQFPSLRDRSPPVIIGQVRNISADSLISETDRTGTAYYRAEISVSDDEMKKLGSSAREIRPGMPVEVVIITRKRSLLQYLSEPLTRNLFRSGSES